MFAEKTVKSTAVGNATHFDDETNGVIGSRKEFGGIADTIEVEIICRRGVGTLMEGGYDKTTILPHS